jgi:hypothetical protein
LGGKPLLALALTRFGIINSPYNNDKIAFSAIFDDGKLGAMHSIASAV